VSNDPYAAPTANLENFADSEVIPTKIMSAKGRLSALSFLGQSMALLLVAMAIFAVLGIVGTVVTGFSPESLASPESFDFSNPLLIVLLVLAAIVYIAVLVISIMMVIKRLHDRNHSGWGSLVMFIGIAIPFVNIVAIIAYLYVMFFPGQKTGNRFGGPRPTKGWEKVLGILYVVLVVGTIVGVFAMGGTALMMGMG